MKRIPSPHRLLFTALFLLASNLWAAPTSQSTNITALGRFETRPPMEGESWRQVIDGNAASALVFAVNSKGEGVLTLTFPTARSIDKIRLHQGQTAYYSTAYRLLGDADGDGTFEKVLAEAKDVAWGEWVEYPLEPAVSLRAVRFQSVTGESKGLRAHPVINEFEVYGAATPAEIEEILKSQPRPQVIPRLKPLYLETALVRDGKAACSILIPATAEYRSLAERIAASIKKSQGVEPCIVTSLTESDPARENVIALGNMNDNPLIERLYWNNYLYLNALYPGGDGFTVQTVHNPYPWTAGHNVIVLGGSTMAGVGRAVQTFLKVIPTAKDGALPRLMQVELPSQRNTKYVLGSVNYTATTVPAQNLTAADIKQIETAEPSHELLAFQQLAQKYLLTGEEAYLQAGKRVLKAVASDYEKDPKRVMTWPEETNSRFIFATWDAVEEAPIFSDAERVRYSNMFLKFLYDLVPHVSDYGNLERNETIVWNHTTFPLLGLYFGGRYFRTGYGWRGMDEFLDKARGAFRGQEKSWKPQEDADSYLSLTMGHTIEYALAENDLDFFNNGNIRKYADYLIGICDNRGYAAGFGDSGLVKSTAIPDAGIPYAYWWTKDPQYLGYLNAIHEGKWLNPYSQTVKPQAPVSYTGLQVYPLDKQVYDYTKTRSYYGEQSGPPTVPYEQAFDKIAFRQNNNPFGQYFILDGYARGKHLHYDGNSLLKLTDKGIDWLVDGDYLVRNTTEHTMISVIHNGRAEKLVPEAAALLHHADFGTHAFVETQTKDYNGIDWNRAVFWQKGGAIVLLDTLQAKEAGDYKFDNVFKCIDANSEQLIAPNRFRISRGTIASGGNIGLETAPRAGVTGKAVVFSRDNARLQFVTPLRTGEYQVTLFAKANDVSSDSLALSVDGGNATLFHIPLDKIGPSSATADKTVPSPTIQIDGDGDHVFTLTLREQAGIVLDRIVIENVANVKSRTEIKAAEARVPVGVEAQNKLGRNFYIVNADGADQTISKRMGSSGPVKYLWQRRNTNLTPGQKVTFANLLYLDDRGETKKYQLQPLVNDADGSAYLGQFGEPTLIGTGAYAQGQWKLNAAMFQISPMAVSLVDATNFSSDTAILTSNQPVSVQFDLLNNQATISAAKPASIRLFSQSYELPVGKRIVKIAAGKLGPKIEAFLKTLKTTNTSEARATTVQKEATLPITPLWRIEDSAAAQPETRSFFTADLDGDGKRELLVCRGNELHCYEHDGKLRWKFDVQRLQRAVTVSDIDGDGKPEVLCGGVDETIHVLDTSGHELSSHKMIERLIVGQGGSVLPIVNTLNVDDLDGDGKKEIIAGFNNSQISAFDSKFQRLWNLGGIYHGVRSVKIADVDGDGKKEVLAADHYGGVSIIKDGKFDIRAASELGDVAVDVADTDGDGKLDILNGSSTGTVTLSAYGDRPLKVRWNFNNAGYAARQVILHDLDGDGKAESLIASDTGYIYALNANGKPRWQTDLGSPVLAMAVAIEGTSKRIVAAQRGGSLRVLSLDGKVETTRQMAGPPKLLQCADLDNDGRDEMVVIDESNRVSVLPLH